MPDSKLERAKAVCEHCAAGKIASIWQGEFVHRWISKPTPSASQFSMTVCRADSIWKEKTDGES